MICEHLAFYFDAEPHDAAQNMAIDEVLARSASLPTLRVYRWAEPSVSFGYFGKYGEVIARWPGRTPIRRWTGGGEVPHGDDFTYTVVVPAAHPFSRQNVRDSYHAIHAALAPLLPGASLARVDAPESPACFARPVVADLVVASKKVAGAAQRRGTFGLLHQGSVQGVAWPKDMAYSFARALGSCVAELSLAPEQLASAASLRAQRYGTVEWLQRR